MIKSSQLIFCLGALNYTLLGFLGSTSAFQSTFTRPLGLFSSTSKSMRSGPYFVSSSQSESESDTALKTENDMKNKIRDLARNTDNGLTAPDAVRKDIESCVKELEDIFETKAKSKKDSTRLVSDQKLDGSWKLVYTTNGGSSAGKLGPFVGEVEQLICLSSSEEEEGNDNDDYYINYVRVGGNLIEGALTATWDELDDKTWQVNFQGIEFKLFGIKLLEKDLEAKGIWRKTYLDEDFRILYASGVTKDDSDGDGSEKKENIYILSK